MSSTSSSLQFLRAESPDLICLSGSNTYEALGDSDSIEPRKEDPDLGGGEGEEEDASLNEKCNGN